MNENQPTQILSWNLAQGNAITQVNWPANNPTDVYQLSDMTLDLELPFGFSVNEWQASNVYIQSRDGKSIYSLILRTHPLTLEDAQTMAIKLAEQFRLDKSRIVQWYTESKQQPMHLQRNFSVFTTLGPSGEEPEVVLESAKSFNDAQPWLLSLSFFWPSAS